MHGGCVWSHRAQGCLSFTYLWLGGRFRGPSGARLLQRRGSLVVRRLATRLGGRAVLSMLSSILEEERDLPFAAALVQALNLILLTAPEVRSPAASPAADLLL